MRSPSPILPRIPIRFSAAALAATLILTSLAAAAQTVAVAPSLTKKLPGQYKVGETEVYCFLTDGTVRQRGAWGERSGSWTASGLQGVITWTRDEVYNPPKPFRDAFNYYEEKGQAKLKLWSLDMPVPAYYGIRVGAYCEAGPRSGSSGPGVISFGGLAWDEWTVRNKIFGNTESDEVKQQESPWSLEGGVLGYKGTGAQIYQDDFVASQQLFDLGEVAVTFEATGSFRTEFGYCGPQVVFADPEQMNSEGPTGPVYGVVAFYSWEPGRTDSGLYMVGGTPPGAYFPAKFADSGDAEFRPYKLQVKGGKVTLTSQAGVFTADAPSAKAGVRLPLVIALRQFDRGRAYSFKIRNLKIAESAPAVPAVPPVAVSPATPPSAVGPAMGKPCAPPEEFAKSLYQTVLGREADADGLRGTTDRMAAGRSREEITKEFFQAKEYEDRKKSDEEFVKDAYRAYIGREADAPGLNGFLSILAKSRKEFMAILDPAGAQRNARSKVLDTFAESSEYRAIRAGCK